MADTIRLNFLGGVNEVGGNSVLLEDFELGVKILIDFGIKIQKFYDQYEKGEHPTSIEELINLSLVKNKFKLLEYLKSFEVHDINVLSSYMDYPLDSGSHEFFEEYWKIHQLLFFEKFRKKIKKIIAQLENFDE